MPKATKKKKEKAADFAKAKLKLGKGKQAPTNQIDTSFKARSISLPHQSIAALKDDLEPTTRRKLTFSDLIAHLKHHNAGSRRDAIAGLRELLEGHLELIEPSLPTLVTACVRIIADEDASVRKMLLSFFGWLLPRIPAENLAPHSPVLLLFTTSAQSHIFPEIQIDAVRLLDLLLDHIPRVVVEGCRDGKGGHGKRVLEGYLSILSAGTKFGEDGDSGPVRATSTASVVLSTASKLVVLRSLAKFLRIVFVTAQAGSLVDDPSSSQTHWYLASSFISQSAYEAFDTLLRSTAQNPSHAGSPTRKWQSEVDPEDDVDHFSERAFRPMEASWSLQDLTENFSTRSVLTGYMKAQGDALQTDFESRLARTLHPILLSSFLDCSPVVFSPTSAPPASELGTVLALADIYRSIYSALIQRLQSKTHKQTDFAGLQAILSRMSIYFPFSPSTLVSRDIKVEQAFQDLSLIFCELTSILSLTAATESAGQKQKSALNDALTSQAEAVSGYVVELLHGGPSTSSVVGRPITSQAYTGLLPTIWSLLNTGQISRAPTSSSVLTALLEHALRTSSSSAVQGPSIDFLCHLMLMDTDPGYTGSFSVAGRPGAHDMFEQWILKLPKVLWEIGDKDPGKTEVVFRFLLRLMQRRSTVVHTQVVAKLSERFIPYFAFTHPTRGELAGPFGRLETPALRRLVLDAMFVVLSFVDGEVRRQLDGAVQKGVRGTDQESYWRELNATLH
ncbi:hypothetical protein FA95DRAFT_1551756 [Auriscalpium vulgare]|uniref:Uncharacterized protein n=1 Tax=Auriscalpium vulgare TaxID=40419 RepID=A0ACB8SCK0_9AGAM|nr:hypothetical protein FA95DRAFT_1551756 [Auriscalpium vulgare]